MQVKNSWERVSSGQRAGTPASTQHLSQLLTQRNLEDKQRPHIETRKENEFKKGHQETL